MKVSTRDVVVVTTRVVVEMESPEALGLLAVVEDCVGTYHSHVDLLLSLRNQLRKALNR